MGGLTGRQVIFHFRSLLAALLIGLLAIAQSSYAADPSAVRVVAVHDGDTITCLTEEKRQVKVRLDAIDAPELAQPFGQRSKQTLSGLVFGKDVTMIPKKTDKYGRTIGHVLVNGEDVNLLMLQAGMAWHYRHFSSNKALQAAEDAARAARQGLWSEPNAVPPWEWRASQTQR